MQITPSVPDRSGCQMLWQNKRSFMTGAMGTLSRVLQHYSDVIMGAMTSQITVVLILHSTVCSDTDQRKHQSSASLAFVRGIHRWPVNSPHKGPVTRKIFPFDDVIMRPDTYEQKSSLAVLLGNVSWNAWIYIFTGVCDEFIYIFMCQSMYLSINLCFPLLSTILRENDLKILNFTWCKFFAKCWITHRKTMVKIQ